MQILQKLNLELYYDKLYDQGWDDSFKTNENYFEDIILTNYGFAEKNLDLLRNKCIKIFECGIKNMDKEILENCIFIVCTRPVDKIIKSIKKIDFDKINLRSDNPNDFYGIEYKRVMTDINFFTRDQKINYVTKCNIKDSLKNIPNKYFLDFELLRDNPKDSIDGLILFLKKSDIYIPDDLDIQSVYNVIHKKN